MCKGFINFPFFFSYFSSNLSYVFDFFFRIKQSNPARLVGLQFKKQTKKLFKDSFERFSSMHSFYFGMSFFIQYSGILGWQQRQNTRSVMWYNEEFKFLLYIRLQSFLLFWTSLCCTGRANLDGIFSFFLVIGWDSIPFFLSLFPFTQLTPFPLL